MISAPNILKNISIYKERLEELLVISELYIQKGKFVFRLPLVIAILIARLSSKEHITDF